MLILLIFLMTVYILRALEDNPVKERKLNKLKKGVIGVIIAIGKIFGGIVIFALAMATLCMILNFR